MEEVAARLSKAPISAQKARLVANLIRRKPASLADQTLQLTNKKAAQMIRKLLNSAISNAENNNSWDIDELYVSTIHVDEGPTQKRMRPRAKGRGNRIFKRSCHITLKVAQIEEL